MLFFFIPSLNGMTYFELPDTDKKDLRNIQVNVVNGTSVELQLSSRIKVLGTPFSPSHPQLISIDGEPTTLSSLKEEALPRDDLIFWELTYGLLNSEKWFSKSLPNSRRMILVAVVGLLVLCLLLKPKPVVWGLCGMALLVFIFLPDYERKVILMAETHQHLFRIEQGPSPDLILKKRGKEIFSEVIIVDAKSINELNSKNESPSPIDSTKVKGRLGGFWSETLVLEDLNAN